MYQSGKTDSGLKLAAIFLGDTHDTSALISFVKEIRSISNDLVVLVSNSSIRRPEIETEANHVEYLASSNLSDALKRAVMIPPADRRILVFFEAPDDLPSASMINRWLKKRADFAQKRRLLILSETYARYIAEREELPSIQNATASGFTVLLSPSQLLLSPKEALKQNWTLAKFLLVGLSGVFVNELLLTVFRIWIPTVFANVIAVEASILSNFVLNDAFTFKPTGKSSAILTSRKLERKMNRLVKYNIVSLVGLLVNSAVFYVLYSNKVFYIWSSLAAILVAFTINYLGSSKWAWKNVIQN